MPALPPRLINIPQANGAGNAFDEINISGSNLILQTNNSGILYGGKLVPSASYAINSDFSISASFALNSISSSYASNAGTAPLPVNSGNEVEVINGTNNTIDIGRVVRFISGSNSGTLIADMPVAELHDPNNKYKNISLGIAKETILSGSKGKAITKGYVLYLNTSTFSNGDILYLKPVISGAYDYGGITNIRPIPPTDIIKIGYVVYANNGDGVIYVDINRSLGFEDIVSISSSNSPVNNSILVYDTSINAWIDKPQSVLETFFIKNRTVEVETHIKQYQSIFNPSNLLVSSSHTFIVEQDADYYVLGDLINDGIIILSGSLKIGGILYNNGLIQGPGILE